MGSNIRERVEKASEHVHISELLNTSNRYLFGLIYCEIEKQISTLILFGGTFQPVYKMSLKIVFLKCWIFCFNVYRVHIKMALL